MKKVSDIDVNIPTVEIPAPEVVSDRPVYKKKHVYESGSPGFNRSLAEVTLTSIKKDIRRSGNRRKYRIEGLIA